jgi:hypothetical protein
VVVRGRFDGEKGKRVRCFDDEDLDLAAAAAMAAATPAPAAAAAVAKGAKFPPWRGGGGGGVGGGDLSRPGTAAAAAPSPAGGLGLTGNGIWPFLVAPLATSSGATVNVQPVPCMRCRGPQENAYPQTQQSNAQRLLCWFLSATFLRCFVFFLMV